MEFLSRTKLSSEYPLDPIAWMNVQVLARRVPLLMREIPIPVGTSDKVFSSEWLSERTLLMGTKHNKLLGVDTHTGGQFEVPSLSKSGLRSKCKSRGAGGIYSISISPSRQYLATAAQNSNYLALYTLSGLIPLSLGEAHTDQIFAIQWLNNNLVVSGSRDSTMAVWSIPTNLNENRGRGNQRRVLAECVPLIKPVICFISTYDERVRDLAYNSNTLELGALHTGNFTATFRLWDILYFRQISCTSLVNSCENVCIQVDSEATNLYAIGSRSHMTFVDSRSHQTCWSVNSLDPNCGVRSLAFNQQLLSVGTGAGHLYFYDMRARGWLHTATGQPRALTTSDGWLRHDELYQDFFSRRPPPPNAIYTHKYSPQKTKLFLAGGPLPTELYGHYAAIWM